jgi:hypothetical protein
MGMRMYYDENNEYKEYYKKSPVKPEYEIMLLFILMFLTTALCFPTFYNIYKRSVAQYELNKNPHVLIEQVEVGNR